MLVIPNETPQDAVAGFLRSFRSEHGLTLDDVARQAHAYGASWGVSTVRNIESGRSSPTLPTLVTLALVLNDLAGTSLALRDVLGDATALASPEVQGSPVKRSWYDSVLSGAPVVVGWSDMADPLRQSDVVIDSLESVGREMPAGWTLPDGGPRPSTLAERRAADRLGALSTVVSGWADHLWGHSLDDEAAARATSDSPQARGRASRLLVDEIASRLTKDEDSGQR